MQIEARYEYDGGLHSIVKESNNTQIDLKKDKSNDPLQNNASNDTPKSHDPHHCPMIDENAMEIVPNLNIILEVAPEIKIHMAIHTDYTIADLNQRIAKYFNIETSSFSLMFNAKLKIKSEDVKFSDLNLKHNNLVEVYLQALRTDDSFEDNLFDVIEKDPHLSDEGTVFVHVKNLKTNVIHTTRVDIEKVPFTKNFIGGFRHKETFVEYHHATTQTRPRPKSMSMGEMFSRDTQTYKIKNSTIENVVTTCTQMTKTGYYVSNVTDLLITPGPYKTADEMEAFILEKVIIIQKYYRRWLAKKRVEKLRKIRQMILDYEISEANRKSTEKAKRLQDLFDKRRCPLYNDDFDLLYNAVEKWRLRQIDKIDPNLPISRQKALKCSIMDEQHEWLLAIERLKIKAIKVLNFRAKKNKLVKVSKPVTWKDKFDNEIQMDLMSTTRGKEVYEIYKSLSMEFFNEEERLDILLTLKRLIKDRPEKISLELLSLINREADLIMRNVSMDLLRGLRTRINTLFLLLCRMPSFNPGVKKYVKVPGDPLNLRGSFQLCRFCNSFLKNTEFMFSVKSKRLGACRTCTQLHNHAMPRQELSPYRLVLNLLQKAEEEHQDDSKMAFIFSEIDIKHLICKIWDSKSILSSNEELGELIFIRWSVDMEWSPWNTALMTHDEAEAHYKLKDPCSAYNEVFLDKIHQKQILGYNYFSSMNELTDRFQVHNLKEEEDRIEAERLKDKELFIDDRKVRFM